MFGSKNAKIKQLEREVAGLNRWRRDLIGNILLNADDYEICDTPMEIGEVVFFTNGKYHRPQALSFSGKITIDSCCCFSEIRDELLPEMEKKNIEKRLSDLENKLEATSSVKKS